MVTYDEGPVNVTEPKVLWCAIGETVCIKKQRVEGGVDGKNRTEIVVLTLTKEFSHQPRDWKGEKRKGDFLF